MAVKSHIVWAQPNPLGPGWTSRFKLHFQAGMAAFTEGFAREVENYAKEHAPWQDRTGEARQGLTAIGKQRLVYYEIELFHTVEYGVWLEVRWNGKYAIIEPTLEVMGPRLMASLDMAVIMKAGGG
jgi:hypothetical protein